MTRPTNKEIPDYFPLHDAEGAGLAAPFAVGCRAADAEYTWHDLMASSPLTASYAISWFLRVVSVPRDLQETSSVSYLRARNVIWTAATCRKAGVKPNTLAEVPLLGETNTWTCLRVCVHRHTLLERMICKAWAPLDPWDPMDLSSVPHWSSAASHQQQNLPDAGLVGQGALGSS